LIVFRSRRGRRDKSETLVSKYPIQKRSPFTGWALFHQDKKGLANNGSQL